MRSIEEYNEVRNQVRRPYTQAIRPLKDSPVMNPSRFMCASRGCDDRILIGVASAVDIIHAAASVRACGWVYKEGAEAGAGALYCPQHKHFAQPIDVLRDPRTGEPL